jgi:hypothetical protein
MNYTNRWLELLTNQTLVGKTYTSQIVLPHFIRPVRNSRGSRTPELALRFSWALISPHGAALEPLLRRIIGRGVGWCPARHTGVRILSRFDGGAGHDPNTL